MFKIYYNLVALEICKVAPIGRSGLWISSNWSGKYSRAERRYRVSGAFGVGREYQNVLHFNDPHAFTSQKF